MVKELRVYTQDWSAVQPCAYTTMARVVSLLEYSVEENIE